MPFPKKFTLSSDFATLSNDGNITVQLIFPASVSIPASGSYSHTVQTTATVGSLGAVTRAQIETSVSPGLWFVGSGMQYVITGGGGVAYQTVVQATRINSTQVTVTATAYNSSFGGATLVTSSTAQIINVRLNTFIAPFI